MLACSSPTSRPCARRRRAVQRAPRARRAARRCREALRRVRADDRAAGRTGLDDPSLRTRSRPRARESCWCRAPARAALRGGRRRARACLRGSPGGSHARSGCPPARPGRPGARRSVQARSWQSSESSRPGHPGARAPGLPAVVRRPAGSLADLATGAPSTRVEPGFLIPSTSTASPGARRWRRRARGSRDHHHRDHADQLPPRLDLGVLEAVFPLARGSRPSGCPRRRSP